MSYVIRVTTGEAFPIEIVGHQLRATTINPNGSEDRNPAYDPTLRVARPEEVEEIRKFGCVRVNRPEVEVAVLAPEQAPAAIIEPEDIPPPADDGPELESAAAVMDRVAAMNEAELRARAADLGIENAERTPEIALRGKVKKAELAARQPKAAAA